MARPLSSILTLLLLGLLTPVSSPAAAPGLVAAYGFEDGGGGSVTDASGNGHVGTISGATWSAAGRYGKALVFDGTTNWVTIADTADLDLTQGMTLSAWVFPTALSGGANQGWRTVVMKEQSSDLAYALYANTSHSGPTVHGFIGGEVAASSAQSLPLNAWTFLAGTYDGAQLRLYVNGTQVASQPLTGSLVASGGPLRIGGDAVWGEYFQGLVDEVRVYNRPLSATEIQADMATPVASGGSGPSVSVTAPQSGAGVGGQVTLAADASDAQGVAGVRFLIDGVAAGAEVSTPPYQMVWDATLVPNGPHTITAQAWDTAGNLGTSAGVGVTVSNGGGGTAFRRVVLGSGFIDAATRQVVRTGSDLVYVFAGDDNASRLGTGPGIFRAWKANQPGIPGAFTEVDGANRPTALGTGFLGSPDVRLDVNGIAHLLYVDRPHATLVYQTFSTITDTWGSPQIVDSNVTIPDDFHIKRAKTTNAILLDAGESPHIIYMTGAGVLYRNRVGGSWSAPVTLSSGGAPVHPQLAADQTGAMHLVWLDDISLPVIRYKRRASDGTWGSTETVAASDIEGNASLDQGPSVVTTSDGTPYVLYISRDPGNFIRVRFRGASGWMSDDPPVDIGTHAPQIYSHGQDIYVFLGHDIPSINYGYVYHLAGQPWANYVRLATERTDGSASVRWDPFRETNPNVIDTTYFAEDIRGDGSFLAELYYMAVLPQASSGVAPSITTHPASQAVAAGNPVTFSVAASGTAPLGYQWQRNGGNIPGATSTSYTIASVSPADNGATFRAVVSNLQGTATSNAATLTVTSSGTAPSITTHPVSQSVVAGNPVTFSVAASGTAPLSYQWQRNGTDIAGATSSSYTIASVSAADNGATFRAVVSNLQGTATSNAATLTVTSPSGTPPSITTQPASQTVATGNPVTFSVAASGTAPLGYRWQRNGADIAGATSSSYTIASVSAADNGATFRAVVSNSAGTATSNAATLTVTSPTANLVAAYSFDEGMGTTVADASGRGHGGTISGATWTTGRSGAGSALSFDGASNWVTINDTAALDLTGGMTLEAWVYPTRAGDWQSIVVKERAGNPSVYALMGSTGTPPAPSGKVFLASGANERIFAPSAPPLNTWTHLATTFDGSTLRFYVNGAQVASRAVSGTILSSTGPLRIGGNSVFGEFFQGRIDDVRIYDRALTPSEIQADMNATVGAAPAGTTTAATTSAGGLVAVGPAPSSSVSGR